MESEPPVDQSEVHPEVNDSGSVEAEQNDTEDSTQWTAFDNQNQASSSENWADFSKPISSEESKSDIVSKKVTKGVSQPESDHGESKNEETNHMEKVEDTLVAGTDEDKKSEHEAGDVGDTKDDKMTNHSEDRPNKINEIRDEIQEDYEGMSSTNLDKND